LIKKKKPKHFLTVNFNDYYVNKRYIVYKCYEVHVYILFGERFLL